VRSSLGVSLVAVCLVLAGCSVFNKKSASSGNNPQPFLGATASAPKGPEPAGDSSSAGVVTPVSGTNNLPPEVNGVLAGQLLDKFNRRPSEAWIMVVDLDDPKPPAAPLDVAVPREREGYFFIKGLTPGHRYRLIARAVDGEQVISGTIDSVTPPNPRLTIYISAEKTTPKTPPIPGRPSVPGADKAPAGSGPAATIDKPVPAAPPPDPPKTDAPKTDSPKTDPPASVGAPAVTTSPAPNATLIGDRRRDSDELPRVPTSPKVDITGPGRDPSPPPSTPAPTYTPPPTPSPSSLAAGTALPGSGAVAGTFALPSPSKEAPAPVPSCQLIGKKLYNFALYDVNGNPWEFRRNRKGRVVLIDCWYTTCGPCLHAVQHLARLQRDYGSWGLEVVGIAYESGTAEQQRLRVKQVKARYGINYTLLMGGGGAGACPVKTNLDVTAFPTLVLVDETNQIVGTWLGLDESKAQELEVEIRRKLGVR
jgi:thiol-disulfide isomerase/thioredoxin